MVVVAWGSVVDGVIGSGGVGVKMPEGMSAGAAHLSVRLLLLMLLLVVLLWVLLLFLFSLAICVCTG